MITASLNAAGLAQPESDEALCRLLEKRETVCLVAPESEWRRVERQVERLGFGDTYLVSYSKGPRGGTIRLSPLPALGDGRSP